LEFLRYKNLYRAKDITPSAHKWNRYADSLSLVLPDSSELANTLYQLILRGRSLANCDGHQYRSEDGVFHLSWLLPDEVIRLHAELTPLESQLDRNDDHAAGVLWVLKATQRALQEGTSLIVAIV